ncbi:MAG: hypothetical protein ACJZ4H_01490 [Candidatus Pelagibacter sp.]
MHFFIFSQSVLSFGILLFICFIFGHFFINIIEKFYQRSVLGSVKYLKPVLGYGIIIIISYYLYINLNLYIGEIIFIFISASFLIFLTLKEKKKFFFDFYNISLISLPIFLIFVIYALFVGEQFYIFRGNYWDNMNYISSGILIKDLQFSDIINLKEINKDHSQILLFNGTANILIRPVSTFLLAQLFYFKVDSFFFTNYLFKVFLIIQIFYSFYFLVSQIKIEKKYFLSFVYIFSFWTLYVFEIDAQSHLGSIPLFLSLLGILLSSKLNNIFPGRSDSILFLLLSVALFIFYPEFFLIFSLFFLLFVFLHKNFLKVLKLEKYKFFYLFIFFLLLTIPSYTTNYEGVIRLVQIATSSKIDYWGYYGLFLLGDSMEIVTKDNIILIKNLFINNQKLSLLFPDIKEFFFKNGYYLIPLNLIPSFFGLYFFTVGKVINFIDIIFIFFTLFLNIYIIILFKRNFLKIFSCSTKIELIFCSFFFIFIGLSLFLLINNNYWTLIKLYSYLGPVIFLFLSININTIGKKRYGLNIFILILLLIFPFYKFTSINDGIGRFDNFPSIINPIYKKEIKWYLDKKKLSSCEKVIFYMPDRRINGHIAIKLYDYGFKHDKKNIFKKKKNKLDDSKNNLCEVKLINSTFKIDLNAKY